MKYYNRTNTCDRCGNKLIPGNPRRECNKDGNWTGNWLCTSCYYKKMRDHRTGNLDPNSNQARGDNFEELTHRWKGVKILSRELDNFNLSYDHSVDSEGKIPQTTGKLYDSRNGLWCFGSLEREWEKEFDYEICYCVSKDGKTIERIYIIPKEEIKDKRKGISITKNPVNPRSKKPIISWYEQYRIKDEDVIRNVNEIWKKIISGK